MRKKKSFTPEEIATLKTASLEIFQALLIEPGSRQALGVRQELFRNCTGQEPVDAIVERYISTRVRQ
jgi:hypothetical protein